MLYLAIKWLSKCFFFACLHCRQYKINVWTLSTEPFFLFLEIASLLSSICGHFSLSTRVYHCAYDTCNSDSRQKVRPQMDGMTWYSFPKMSSDPEKCEKCVKVCRRAGFYKWWPSLSDRLIFGKCLKISLTGIFNSMRVKFPGISIWRLSVS